MIMAFIILLIICNEIKHAPLMPEDFE